MSKTITYLDIRRRVECKTCSGSGEYIPDNAMSTDGQMYAYVCKKCRGKGYKMKRQTVSLEQFRLLKN